MLDGWHDGSIMWKGKQCFGERALVVDTVECDGMRLA